MTLYRLLLTLLAPIVAALLAWRLLRGRESGTDLRERLGLDGPERPSEGRVLWLHGASNGELTSARALIEALLASSPDRRIVVTVNSVTGRDMVRGWNLPRLRARLAPLDYRLCLLAFLSSHRPGGFLLLEGDLWPNRFAMLEARGTPVAIASARISARSFGTWRRLGALSRKMLGSVALLSAQDAASEERYRALGLPDTAVAPQLTLKSSVALPEPETASLAPFRAIFDRDETILAASTHAGEEAQVIAAFVSAREHRPALRMILAPRHPKRGDEIEALLDQAGLRIRRRSRGEAPDAGTDVFLADTLGEMPLWYALSGICFVGGSLIDKGGHTPFEPAQFGCAILHGPHLSNFAEPYEALAEAGGAAAVANAEALASVLAGLDAAHSADLADKARHALHLDGGEGLANLLARIEKTFPSVSDQPATLSR